MPGSRCQPRRLALGAAILLAGCADTTGTPLIDIPELRVITATVARGAPVQLEVTNTTASEVILPSPVCSTRLELFSQGRWFDLPSSVPECVGIPVTLAPGAAHQFGIPVATEQAGRHRAVVTGSNADGAFVVRSAAFTVE